MKDEYSVNGAGDTGLARAYIDRQLPQIHGAFGTPASFDLSLGQYTEARQELEIAGRARLHTEHFQKAAERYLQENKQRHGIDVDIYAKHSWCEVVEEVRKLDRYQDGQQSVRGRLRKAFRWCAEIEPSIDPWLGLMPKDGYYSVLHGGLKIILATVARIRITRTKVLDMLDEISDTLRRMREFLDLYANKSLANDMTEYYLAILTAVAEMMAWSTTKTGLKLAKSFFQGDPYTRKLDESLDNVKKRQVAFVEKLKFLHHQVPLQTRSELRDVQTTVHHVSLSIQEVGQTSASKMDEVKSAITAMNGMLMVLTEQVKKSEWNRKSEKWKDRVQKKNRRLEVPVPSHVQTQLSDKESAAKCHRLRSCLDVRFEALGEELDMCIRWNQSARTSEQRQAQSLMHSSLLQEWLRSADSAVLLVDGSSQFDRISALSSFASSLVCTLNRLQTVRSIYFFCGLHDRDDDHLSGAVGLIRSLTGQLLRFQEFNLATLQRKQLRRIGHGDLATLCDVFRQLVAELSFDTVLFCVIDGYSALETSAERDDLCYVSETLSHISTDERVNAVFKLLFCTPDPSRYIKAGIPRECRFEIPDVGDLDEDDDQVTDREMRTTLAGLEVGGVQ